jgi:acylphosphatase
VFTGRPQAVDELVAWCRKGPPNARVDGVAATAQPGGPESGFRVLR